MLNYEVSLMELPVFVGGKFKDVKPGANLIKLFLKLDNIKKTLGQNFRTLNPK